MQGDPQVIYTDEEGAFTTKEFQELLEEKKIKHIITRGHAAVAESTKRTIKNMINKRLEAANQPDSKWIDILNQVLFVYNYKNEHSATGMTPMQAREPKNEMKVRLRLELKRKSTRKYPDVVIGNKVKIYTKKKQFEKEHVPVWSKETHVVEDITESMNQKYYKVSNFRRPLLRHEILLVKIKNQTIIYNNVSGY